MNYDSCKMIRVDTAEAVEQGAPGSFCIEYIDGKHPLMWVKLPHGERVGITLEPAAPDAPFVWQWNRDENRPTVWREIGGRKLDINLVGRWHGRIHRGRLESLEAAPTPETEESPPAKKKTKRKEA